MDNTLQHTLLHKHIFFHASGSFGIEAVLSGYRYCIGLSLSLSNLKELNNMHIHHKLLHMSFRPLSCFLLHKSSVLRNDGEQAYAVGENEWNVVRQTFCCLVTEIVALSSSF